MSQSGAEKADANNLDNLSKGLLVAAGTGLVIGTMLGSRALKRTIKIVLIRAVVKRVLRKFI